MDTETVTVIRPAGRDLFGDPLPGDPGQFELPGCLFAPGSSTEATIGANRVLADADLYAPAGSDLQPTDRVLVRGKVYDVIGMPQVWGTAGVVAALRISTG